MDDELKVNIMIEVDTIKMPDNDLDRKKMNKKGFSNKNITNKIYGNKHFQVPEKYSCKHIIKQLSRGCEFEWTVYNKKTKKPVVSLTYWRDGDYPPPEKVVWY